MEGKWATGMKPGKPRVFYATGDCSAFKGEEKHLAVVGWVGMFSVWGVWVARAVPPPTCAHGGSVGAFDTPKLCPVCPRTTARPVATTSRNAVVHEKTNR